MIASAPRRNASPRATSSAADRVGATIAPGIAKSRDRLMMMLVRPGSGRLVKDRKVLRPTTTGLPQVRARKRCISDLIRQGSAPARPMTPLRATAATRTMSIRRLPSRPAEPAHADSHRDLRLDMRMGIVAFESEVLIAEREQVAHRREPQGRQRTRRARKLRPRLLDVVQIEVRVAEGMDELARPMAG